MTAQIGNVIGSGALGAGATYLAETLQLATLDPVSGALFGVTGRLIHEVTYPIFDKIDNLFRDSYIGPQWSSLVSFTMFISSVAITAAACTALGIPMTFTTALVLQVAQRAIGDVAEFALVGLGFGRPLPVRFTPIVVETLSQYTI